MRKHFRGEGGTTIVHRSGLQRVSSELAHFADEGGVVRKILIRWLELRTQQLEMLKSIKLRLEQLELLKSVDLRLELFEFFKSVVNNLNRSSLLNSNSDIVIC